MEPKTTSSRTRRKRSFIWILLAVALAIIALGALWWWKSTVPSLTATCQPGDLRLDIGTSQVAEGTEFVHAVVTNEGKTACTINGYPIVSLLDAKGENFTTGDAQHNDFYAPQTITLNPRGQAHAVVGLPQADNFGEGVCSGILTTLRLYLPVGEVTPGVTALTTPLERRACPGFSVTAFRPGA